MESQSPVLSGSPGRKALLDSVRSIFGSCADFSRAFVPHSRPEFKDTFVFKTDGEFFYSGDRGFLAPEEFSGHSLRAGLATSAAEAGQQERDIMQQTRHKSEKMVRRYIRKGSLFQGNVVDALGF
jgi:integrase